MASRTAAQDKKLFGVPARFMRPRLLLLFAVFALMAFGFLMIYSSSSVEALAEEGDPASFVKRQAISATIGLVLASIMAFPDYHTWTGPMVSIVWLVTVAILVATAAAGFLSHGAQRWIEIGGMSVQPSEFAKIGVVIVAARLCQAYFEDGSLGLGQALGLAAVGVLLPLVLIVGQPDKGTTIILSLTVIVMLYLSGLPMQIILMTLGIVAVVGLVLSLGDDYSRRRIFTMLNPQSDPYGDGYQLLQGFYAFGSGGLFGVGLGRSSQKYAYLPEAHNDFIFAIIGEELGFVGAVLILALFALLIWAGFEIMRYAPDLTGKLIAAGCTSLLGIQLFVNIMGVIGIMPLTGKPLPFISYGGSSIMSCLMLVGLILSVSRSSQLPETIHDRTRRSMMAHEGRRGAAPAFTVIEGGIDGSTAGEARPRSTRLAGGRNPIVPRR